MLPLYKPHSPLVFNFFVIFGTYPLIFRISFQKYGLSPKTTIVFSCDYDEFYLYFSQKCAIPFDL